MSIDRRSPGYCRVTFDHAPINMITAMRRGIPGTAVDFEREWNGSQIAMWADLR